MKTVPLHIAVVLVFFANPSFGATFTWTASTPGITTNANSLSQTVDGTTVTASGYVAEFGFSSSTTVGFSDANVVRPFPTSATFTSTSFANARLRPFGIDLRNLGLEQLVCL